MAQLNYQADPDLKPSYGLIEPGNYLAMIIASEMKPNKARTGEYLQLTVEVIDGQYKGRKVFDRLNIRNQNKTAEHMAIESLNALCLATSVLHLNDSEQLHNIPVMITVDIEEGKEKWTDALAEFETIAHAAYSRLPGRFRALNACQARFLNLQATLLPEWPTVLTTTHTHCWACTRQTAVG